MLVRWTCEVVSVSAWMMLCSVSATVGSGGKVTVDNFAGGPVCGGGVRLRGVDGHSRLRDCRRDRLRPISRSIPPFIAGLNAGVRGVGH